MKDPCFSQALDPIIQTLEDLGISYQIVGSVASSAYGKDRFGSILYFPLRRFSS
jgi:hypothetical protein